MTEPLGPPTPPTAEKAYNNLRRSVTVTIPASLKRTQIGLAKMRRRRRGH